MPILHDPDSTRAAEVAQQMARLELRCSVCEDRVDAAYELDDSGRCKECQP